MVQLRSVCQIGHIGKNIDEVGSDFATTCCICVGDQTPTIVCLAQIFQEKRDVTIPLSYGEKHSRHRRHWVIDGNYYFSEGSRPQKVSLHKKATLARLAPASKTFLLLERDLSQGKFPSTNNGKTAKPAVFMGEASDHQKNKRSLLPLDIFLMFFCGLQPASICCYTYNTFW